MPFEFSAAGEPGTGDLLAAARRVLGVPVEQPLPVRGLLSLLRRQGVPLVLVLKALRAASGDGEIQGAAEWAAAIARTDDLLLQARREYGRVSEAWRGVGVRALCLTLAGTAPPLPYGRSVEVLVRGQDVPLTRQVLRDEGYVELRNREGPGAWLFCRYRAGRCVSAIRLYADAAGDDGLLCEDRVWAGARAGREDPRLVVPGPEDALLITVAHMVTRERAITLRHLMVIRQALQQSELDWGYMESAAGQRGWGATLALGLIAAAALEDRLWGASLLPVEVRWRYHRELAGGIGLKRYAARIERAQTLPVQIPLHVWEAALLHRISARDANGWQRVARMGAAVARTVPEVAGIRPQQAMLFSLSGIDGSGKSSHARAVQRAFAVAGIGTRGVTSRVGNKTPLRWLREVVRKRVPRPAPSRTSHAPPASDTGRSRWQFTYGPVWAVATAVDYALWLQWVRWHLLRGRVVIADRYLCDFAVEMTVLVTSRPRLAAWLIRAVRLTAPRPAYGYFLRVPAEVSRQRKPHDHHGFREEEVCEAYEALYGDYDLHALDNQQNFEVLSNRIVRDVLTMYMDRFHPVLSRLFPSTSRHPNPEVEGAERLEPAPPGG